MKSSKPFGKLLILMSWILVEVGKVSFLQMRSNWVILFIIFSLSAAGHSWYYLLCCFEFFSCRVKTSADPSWHRLLGSLELLVDRVQPPPGFCPPENIIQVDVPNRNVIILALNAGIFSFLLVVFILKKLQGRLKCWIMPLNLVIFEEGEPKLSLIFGC